MRGARERAEGRSRRRSPLCAFFFSFLALTIISFPTVESEILSEFRTDEKARREAAAQGRRATSLSQQEFSPKALRTNLLDALVQEEMAHRQIIKPVPQGRGGTVLRVTWSTSLTAPPTVMAGVVMAWPKKGMGTSVVMRAISPKKKFAYNRAFELFSPLVREIEVLKLARRKKGKLYHLVDLPNRYSNWKRLVYTPPGEEVKAGKYHVMKMERKRFDHAGAASRLAKRRFVKSQKAKKRLKAEKFGALHYKLKHWGYER